VQEVPRVVQSNVVHSSTHASSAPISAASLTHTVSLSLSLSLSVLGIELSLLSSRQELCHLNLVPNPSLFYFSLVFRYGLTLNLSGLASNCSPLASS
jgi:hypothetical protein